jgi:hypothetical protein
MTCLPNMKMIASTVQKVIFGRHFGRHLEISVVKNIFQCGVEFLGRHITSVPDIKNFARRV